jgi:hypothetical protein
MRSGQTSMILTWKAPGGQRLWEPEMGANVFSRPQT